VGWGGGCGEGASGCKEVAADNQIYYQK
jgi:hypothetical protein